MENTPTSVNKKDLDLQSSIPFSQQLPPIYGESSLEPIENISDLDLQNFLEPRPEANYLTLKSPNTEIINSETTDTFKQLIKSWNLEHLTEFLICKILISV